MNPNALTVGDLVETESLDTRVLAGGQGLDRVVLWAHSCEMFDPAEWLGPDELLMTVGLCVPKDAAGQAEFIERMHAAGLSGMMLGDHEPKPDLSREMLETADRLGFPVLLAGARTPYAAVARHVAAVTSTHQTLQVLRLSKLYQIAAAADDDSSLVADLARSLGVGLRVEDDLTGLEIVTAGQTDDADNTARRSRLGTRRPTTLAVSHARDADLDSFLQVHLAKVLQVAIDRLDDAATRRQERSNRILLSLLNGAGFAETADFIAPHLASEGFRLVGVAGEDAARLERVGSLARMPVLVGAGRTHHLALVPSAAVNELRTLLARVGVQAGVSSTFTDFADTRTAAAESARVHDAIRHGSRLWGEYEGASISVLARSRREASEIVDGVLGPLTGEDARTVALRETLFAFLRNDRSWTETAAELRIHRQTLGYRLQRVQAVTGLDLSRSGDFSAAWIAYQAWPAR